MLLKLLRMILYFLIGLVIACLLLAGYAAFIEPNWLQVEQVPIITDRLPEDFAGVTVAQISDFHLGNSDNQAKVHAAVDRVLALKPDLILLTGDFVSSLRSDEAQILEAEVARLSAPLGVYAILGNHDWWSDAERVAGALRQAGATLLDNSNVPLVRGASTLYLAGLEDIYENPDLRRTLSGVPEAAPVILMAHEPDQAAMSVTDERIFLQVSGHTHGGQIRPFFGKAAIALPIWGEKYDCGYYRVGSLQIYVNRGIGVTFPALRLFCRPEITLFTLQQASSK